MNKKFILVLVILFGGMAFVFYEFKTNLPKEESDINVSNKEEVLLGKINHLELYMTDYQYDTNISGYNYTKIDLTNEQIKTLKKELANIDLNNKIQDVVYGQYKLVIDDKTIYFDINTDSALYLENNQVFRLSNEIKKQFITNNNTCSCCTTSKCKINLCACPTS